MDKQETTLKVCKWVGYALLAVYATATIAFLIAVTQLGVLPATYLVITSVFLIIIGIIISFFHNRTILRSVIASVVTLLIIACFAISAFFVQQTNRTLEEIVTVKAQTDVEPPEELPSSFIMYISAIDTVDGNISTRSESNINILMVVNTVNREVLLLTTPRDAFIAFPASGEAQDKLAHAGIYGVDQSIQALEALYDIHIDYFFRLNFTGFMDIQALIAEATLVSLLMNYNSVLAIASDSFETNMPQEHITALARMQLVSMTGWRIIPYTTIGHNDMAETFSMPGYSLYVTHLNEESIEEAMRLIDETMR